MFNTQVDGIVQSHAYDRTHHMHISLCIMDDGAFAVALRRGTQVELHRYPNRDAAEAAYEGNKHWYSAKEL